MRGQRRHRLCPFFVVRLLSQCAVCRVESEMRQVRLQPERNAREYAWTSCESLSFGIVEEKSSPRRLWRTAEPSRRVRDWTAGGSLLATLGRKFWPAGSSRRNARRTWMDPPEGASRRPSARAGLLATSIQTKPIPPETPMAVVRAPGQPRPAPGCVVAAVCPGVPAGTGMWRRPRRRSGPCRSARALAFHAQRVQASQSTVTFAPIPIGFTASSGAFIPRALQVGRD